MSFYDPLKDYRRSAAFNGSMSHDEQLDWVDKQTFRDPDWAENESTIRKLAIEVQRSLKGNGPMSPVETYIHRPSKDHPLGIETVKVAFLLTRLGGIEERLLIEENLRRAMYG